jgi:predicted nucleic acid-binding protein
MYCLDASVIVSSQLKKEVFYFQSKRFLERVKREKIKIFLPEIVIPEIISGVFRGTQNKKLTLEFVSLLRELPNFLFIPVDAKLSNLAGSIITETGLKANDAIYVALAYDYDLELITLDKDQLEKGKKFVKTRMP